MAQPARTLEIPVISREEFYEFESVSLVRHERYAGQVVAQELASPIHARIVGEIIGILGKRLVEQRCYAVPNDQMVRVEEDDLDAYPDVVVYCDESRFDPIFPRTLIEPRVLFEVLSPSTRNVDLTTKLQAYFKLPSLTDYLIVWQDMVRIDQYSRLAGTTSVSETPNLTRHVNRSSVVRLGALDVEFTAGEIYRFLDVPEGALDGLS